MPPDENGIRSSGGRTPWAVRVGTWLLLFILVRGALGVALIGREFYRAWSTGAAKVYDFGAVGLPQVLWMLQWALAGVALWALSRRRRVGRWLAVGLVLWLAYQPAQELWVALEAARGHADLRLKLVGYRSRGEGLGGILANLPLALGLLGVGLRLALGANVAEFFRAAPSAGADPARRPTRA